jgi:predicted nucleotidyltransferase
MNILQKVVILLNFKPCSGFFRAAYSFGLNRLISRLKKHPAVHSVYGCGSFFEGGCLYGLSDIDLILVMEESTTRADEEPYKIAETYSRVSRLFPFLGSWSEKAENIIYLSEVRAGFPLPESFRLRWKQGRLVHLYGRFFPEELVAGPLSLGEVVTEIDTVLRLAITKGEAAASNKLFWKRIFNKLFSLTDSLDFKDLAEQLRNTKTLAFLKGNDISLFFRKSRPGELFQLLLEFTQKIFNRIRQETEFITRTYKVLDDGSPAALGKPASNIGPRQSEAIARICQATGATLESLRPSLFGISPRFNYFRLDQPVPLLDIPNRSYEGLRAVVKLFLRHGKESESVLVRAQGFLFIACKQPEYIDLVPLNPFVFANIHVQKGLDSESFQMPVSIYQEQKAASARMFLAFAGLYQKNEGRIKKMPYPCLYLEDDLRALNDAFHRLRVYLWHSDGVDIRNQNILIEFLANKYPSCRSFLNDLLDFHRYLTGQIPQKRIANNLYRCLHQFMSQMLSGSRAVALDPHWKHLGITVGIITRNRADDLQEVLDSLTCQVRPADEVLIVDNGSSDQTLSIATHFQQKLPLSYYYLAEASIPKARNLVLELAKNDIIAFTDDDCLVDSHWLEAIERSFLRADNIGMVGGWVKHEPAPKPSLIDTYCSLFQHNTT